MFTGTYVADFSLPITAYDNPYIFVHLGSTRYVKLISIIQVSAETVMARDSSKFSYSKYLEGIEVVVLTDSEYDNVNLVPTDYFNGQLCNAWGNPIGEAGSEVACGHEGSAIMIRKPVGL